MRDEVQLRHEEKAWDINMMQSDEQKPSEDTTSVEGEAKRKRAWWRRRWIWILFVVLLIAVAAFRTEIKYCLHIPIATKTIMLPGDVPLELLWIPGVSSKTSEGNDDFQTVNNGFWMGKTECTQEQWTAVMGVSYSDSTEEDEERRVAPISWNEAQVFISALNELTGEAFRLPTISEWEYAALAGRRIEHSFITWCENPLSEGYSEYYRPDSSEPLIDFKEIAKEIRRKFPNSWGLYAIADNIYEWCQDSCNRIEDADSSSTDYLKPDNALFRSIRNFEPIKKSQYAGFRLVLPEFNQGKTKEGVTK